MTKTGTDTTNATLLQLVREELARLDTKFAGLQEDLAKATSVAEADDIRRHLRLVDEARAAESAKIEKYIG